MYTYKNIILHMYFTSQAKSSDSISTCVCWHLSIKQNQVHVESGNIIALKRVVSCVNTLHRDPWTGDVYEDIIFCLSSLKCEVMRI